MRRTPSFLPVRQIPTGTIYPTRIPQLHNEIDGINSIENDKSIIRHTIVWRLVFACTKNRRQWLPPQNPPYKAASLRMDELSRRRGVD